MKTRQINLKNSMIRVDKRFKDEIEHVQARRLEVGSDSEVYGDKLSARELTKLIIRHRRWTEIKNDIINFGLEEEENENEH